MGDLADLKQREGSFDGVLPPVLNTQDTSQPTTPLPATKASDVLLPDDVLKARVNVAPQPRDKSQYEPIYQAVKQIEGVGLDKRSGAISGIMPDSARDLGFRPEDRNDYNKALQMQRMEVDRYYEKYGNWSDALVAFDWGPRHADEWIAKGRPTNLLPQETQDYLKKASSLTGMNLASSVEGSYVSGKRQLTVQDLKDREARYLDGKPSGEPVLDMTGEEPDEVGLLQDEDQIRGPSLGEPGQAFMAGALREPMNLVLGPVQTGVQMYDEDTARQLTAQVNDLDERLGIAELARKEPAFYAMGGIAGTTASIMVGAGLLGATSLGRAATDVVSQLSRLKRLGLSALAGAGVLGTTFHQDLDEANRYLEAALGTVLGPVAVGIGSSVGWGSKYLARQDAFQKFVGTLQSSVGEWSRSTSQIKDAMLGHYRKLMGEAERLYGLRDVAGRDFEGFDPDRLSDALKRAVPTEAREQGISTVVTVNKVKDELGLHAHEARKEAHEEALQTHAKAQAVYDRAVDKLVPGGVSAQARESIIRQAGDLLPEAPVVPEAFVAKPVEANRFSAALQAINRARLSKLTDAQSRRQLSALERELMIEAETQADRLGMSGKEYLRRQEEANEFYKREIGPIRDMFAKATPEQIERGFRKDKTFTNADFADRVSRVLKTNDVDKMRMLGKVMGPAAKDEMIKVVEKEMLDRLTEGMTGQNPTRAATKRFTAYIKDRKDGLIGMLGRERVTELEGAAKLSEHLAAQNIQHRIWGWGTRSILPFIGVERIAEGIWHGDPARGLREGVGFILAPFFVHAMHDTLARIRNNAPYLIPQVRALAKMKPETPEFDKAVGQLTARLTGQALAGGRVLEQATISTPSP